MGRTYAILKENKVVSVQILEEDEVREISRDHQNVIDVEDIAPQPQVNWVLSGNKLVPPTPIPMTAELLKNTKIKALNVFVQDLANTMIAENILMGITQAGKSGAVLALANKRVSVASAPEPVSFKQSMMDLTLTVTIDILDYFIQNPVEYDGLQPFITETRLRSIKNTIQAYLGLPLT